MAQPHPEPVKMPGLPQPRPERHRRRPQTPASPRAARQAAPAPRLRLAWSRAIVDQNCASVPLAPAEIPNVRSTAAMRARAGMPDPSRTHIALDPLLVPSAHAEPIPAVHREFYRPAPDPDPIPAPEPTFAQRCLQWLTAIVS